MHFAASLVVFVLGQNPVAAPPSAVAPAVDERIISAMERTAAAAERTAQAVEKLAATDGGVPEAPVAAAPASGWTGTVGVGLVSLTGNAESLTLTGLAAFERKTEHWIVSAKANGAYGQARTALDVTTEAQIVAMRAMGELRGDRRLTEKVSTFLLAGAETDHVKSIEARGYGEAGVSSVWVEDKVADYTRMYVRTDLALRYAKENRYQYFPTPVDVADVSIFGPRFGFAFRYFASKGIGFVEEAEVIPDLLGDSRVLVNSTSKLQSRLTESLAVSVAFVVNHDSRPAPGKLRTDTALTAGLEVAF